MEEIKRTRQSFDLCEYIIRHKILTILISAILVFGSMNIWLIYSFVNLISKM